MFRNKGISRFIFLTIFLYSCGFGSSFTWQKIADEIPASNILGIEMVEHNNRVWLLNGANTTGVNKTTWSSSDMKEWIVETTNNTSANHISSGIISFKDHIWLIGGMVISTADKQQFEISQTVWKTTDTKSWIKVTEKPGFTARYNFGCAVFKEKIWVLGGSEQTTKQINDIWFSSNGTQWEKAPGTPPWKSGLEMVAFAFKNKLWLFNSTPISKRNDSELAINGNANQLKRVASELWSSEDGITWQLVSNSLPPEITGIFGNSIVTTDEHIIVCAGFDEFYDPTNTVIYSSNGKDWNSLSEIPWESRGDHVSVYFKNKLFLLLGTSSDNKAAKDVWCATIKQSTGTNPVKEQSKPTNFFDITRSSSNVFKISFGLVTESAVQLTVHNIRGQNIMTLFKGIHSPGMHSVVWNGSKKNTEKLSSGNYIVKLRIGQKNFTKHIRL